MKSGLIFKAYKELYLLIKNFSKVFLNKQNSKKDFIKFDTSDHTLDPFLSLSMLFLPPMIIQDSVTVARMCVLNFFFFTLNFLSFPFLINTTLLCSMVQRPCTTDVYSLLPYLQSLFLFALLVIVTLHS